MTWGGPEDTEVSDIRIEFLESSDGRRIVKAIFHLDPEEASSPMVWVTYEKIIPDSYDIKKNQYLIELLASVREDTLEPVTLTPEMRKVLRERVAVAAAQDDPDWKV